MSITYLAVWALMLVFAASAIYGLVWAIQHGQLGQFRAGARSIFDDEEPVGVPTDALVRQVPPGEALPPAAPSPGRSAGRAGGGGVAGDGRRQGR
jgi:nitrogen fixation-related uncharacterized protein